MDTTFLSDYDDYPADLPFAASWVDGAGGSFVAAVWRDGGIGVGGGGFGGGIAFSSTSDNGVTWTSPPRALTVRHNGYFPKVVVRGDIIVAAWSAILDTTDHVNFRWSSDRGLTWSPVCDLVPNALVAVSPAVAITENAIHIAWMEERDSLWNLFYKRGTLPPSSVGSPSSGAPAGVRLHRNYPNPFNPSTTIAFDLPERGEVKLRVFDILGREVVTLVDRTLEAGRHRALWQTGTNASGVYLSRLTVHTTNGTHMYSMRMLLLR